MQHNFSTEDLRFREEVREFLDASLSSELRQAVTRNAGVFPLRHDVIARLVLGL